MHRKENINYMSERNYAVLNKNKLTDLADSIRQKTNTEDKLTVAAMTEAITNLNCNDNNDNITTTINIKIEQSPHQTIRANVDRLFDDNFTSSKGGSVRFLKLNATATVKPERGYIAGKLIEEKVGNTIKFSATPAEQDDLLYINDSFEVGRKRGTDESERKENYCCYLEDWEGNDVYFPLTQRKIRLKRRKDTNFDVGGILDNLRYVENTDEGCLCIAPSKNLGQNVKIIDFSLADTADELTTFLCLLDCFDPNSNSCRIIIPSIIKDVDYFLYPEKVINFESTEDEEDDRTNYRISVSFDNNKTHHIIDYSLIEDDVMNAVISAKANKFLGVHTMIVKSKAICDSIIDTIFALEDNTAANGATIVVAEDVSKSTRTNSTGTVTINIVSLTEWETEHPEYALEETETLGEQ